MLAKTQAIVRDAEPKDIGRLLAMGRCFHSEAGMSQYIAWDNGSTSETLLNLMGQDGGILLVAEMAGEVVGMVGGLVHPVYFNSAHMSGQELFWWVAPAFRGSVGGALLAALEEKAKALGARTWSMIALEAVEPERVASIYMRHGYAPSERHFIKVLD